MRSSKALALAACAATVFLLSGAAQAEHIPDHNNSDPVFPIPIPEFDGGVIHALMIGPEAGVQIIGTRYDVWFQSDGEMPASELLIDFSAQVDNDFREMTVSGAQLGFTSGPGLFHGTFETDFYNGTVWQFPMWPHSLPEIEIHSTQGGVSGNVLLYNSFIYLDVIPVPEPVSVGLLLPALLIASNNRKRR